MSDAANRIWPTAQEMGLELQGAPAKGNTQDFLVSVTF